MIPLYPSKRPPASHANWRSIMRINAHETWKGNCPNIEIFNDAGGKNTYFPHYYKVTVEGAKPKYFFGEFAERKVNQYLFDLGADTTI